MTRIAAATRAKAEAQAWAYSRQKKKNALRIVNAHQEQDGAAERRASVAGRMRGRE